MLSDFFLPVGDCTCRLCADNQATGKFFLTSAFPQFYTCKRVYTLSTL